MALWSGLILFHATFCPAEGLFGVNTSLRRTLEIALAQEAGDTNGSSQRIHIGGEAGAGFFHTGYEGQFPNDEFRLDEAKLFVEAQVMKDVYVFGELNLMTREEGDENVSIGEFYIEFENVSKLWNRENILNIRAGRLDIPFGEEYLTRDVIDNPLITHSLSDIWGVDEGVELYGSSGQFEYTFAIQNGGDPALHDYNSDKAIVGRFTYRPSKSFHALFSAMRTGKLDAAQDQFSAMWFGNGLLRLLGSSSTATTFQGNVFEGDGHVQWNGGHIHLAAGHLEYQDDDSAAYNTRKIHYYQIEAVQNLKQRRQNVWYAAARFGRIDADPEFPIVGMGDYHTYLFDYATETKFLWRFSLGTGYRIGRNLLLKMEYSFERGEQANGVKRDQEDFFGVVVAAKF